MLAPLGLRLAPEKTRVVHIDEGFDFLGHHIRRMRKRGTSKYYVYTKPSRKAIQAIKDKVKAKTYRSTRHMDLDELIISLNRSLAGWANYFRHGVSKATFSAIDNFTWGRLMRWIRAKYAGQHRARDERTPPSLLRPGVEVRLQRGRLHRRIQRRRDPLPLPRQHHPDPMDPETGSRHKRLTSGQDTWSARCGESRTPGAGGDLRETDRWQHRHRARGSTSPTATPATPTSARLLRHPHRPRTARPATHPPARSPRLHRHPHPAA